VAKARSSIAAVYDGLRWRGAAERDHRPKQGKLRSRAATGLCSPRVLGLGGACHLRTSKTRAVIRKQAPIAKANILTSLHGMPLTAVYDGYTSGPIVADYGKASGPSSTMTRSCASP
jgi:hypothetical protein